MNTDVTATRAQVTSLLSILFSNIIESERIDFASLEQRAISLVHEISCESLSLALELLDTSLCLDGALPEGSYIHDKRKRTLASPIGDISFSYRRARDAYGNTSIPLADYLDLPWSCRITPGAQSFLVDAGAEVSYAKASRLLARYGGSCVSPVSVMRFIHGIGEACAQEDEQTAHDLYVNGVLPDAQHETSELCLEADGTWISLQHVPQGQPSKVEVKALVAYEGKHRQATKVSRSRPIRHGCVGKPDAFWPQGIAAVGTRFDLSKLELCHLGTDGESWCKRGGEWIACPVQGHLDPFHLDRYVLGCFSDQKLAWKVVEVVMDGDTGSGIEMIETARELGLTKGNSVDAVIRYLHNNASIIGNGPSLGTMEAENQHVYGSRMDSVPCAWSRKGADSMARIRSRKASGRSLPKMTRESSVTPRRRKRTERRQIESLERLVNTRVPMTDGHGYEPPHRASVADMIADIRYHAGIDSGMVVING